MADIQSAADFLKSNNTPNAAPVDDGKASMNRETLSPRNVAGNPSASGRKPTLEEMRAVDPTEFGDKVASGEWKF